MWKRILTKLRDIKNEKKELDKVLPEWNFYADQFQEGKHGSISYRDLDKIIGAFKGCQIIGERESIQIIRSFSDNCNAKNNTMEIMSEKINDRVLKKIGDLEARKKETKYELFESIRQHFLSHVYILFIPTMFIFLNSLFSKAINSQNCVIISKETLYIIAGVVILFVCISESSMWLKNKPKFGSSLFAIVRTGLLVMCLLICADACPIDLSAVHQFIKAPKLALVMPHLFGFVMSYTLFFVAWSMVILGWLHLEFFRKVIRNKGVNEVLGEM